MPCFVLTPTAPRSGAAFGKQTMSRCKSAPGYSFGVSRKAGKAGDSPAPGAVSASGALCLAGPGLTSLLCSTICQTGTASLHRPTLARRTRPALGSGQPGRAGARPAQARPAQCTAPRRAWAARCVSEAAHLVLSSLTPPSFPCRPCPASAPRRASNSARPRGSATDPRTGLRLARTAPHRLPLADSRCPPGGTCPLSVWAHDRPSPTPQHSTAQHSTHTLCGVCHRVCPLPLSSLLSHNSCVYARHRATECAVRALRPQSSSSSRV